MPRLGFVWQRGHLIGSQLGGEGGANYNNLIPMSPASNILFRDEVENPIANAARNQCVFYWVWAGYVGDDLSPTRITAIAIGDGGLNLSKRIDNP